MKTSSHAPDVVLSSSYLVKKRRLNERCACVKAELTCTYMCECTDTHKMCENSLSYQDVVSDDDSDDGDDASDEEDGHSDIDWDTYFD